MCGSQKLTWRYQSSSRACSLSHRCVWVHFVGAFGAATAGIDPLLEAVGDVEGGVALWERADERLVARPPKRGHPEPA